MTDHRAVIPPRTDNVIEGVVDKFTHRYRTYFEDVDRDVTLALRGSELLIDATTTDNVNAKDYGRYIKAGGAVSFPERPNHAATIYVKSIGSNIYIYGGGKNIDSTPSVNVNPLLSETFIYDSNTDQWYTM